MEPNLRQPRRFRVRLGTLLVVIAFLALLLGMVVESVQLQRERRRLAAFADQLAQERARAQASLRQAEAAHAELQALVAGQGSKTGSDPKKADPAAKR